MKAKLERLRVRIIQLADPCPCCDECAPAPLTHSDECTFATDCPVEAAAMAGRWEAVVDLVRIVDETIAGLA